MNRHIFGPMGLFLLAACGSTDGPPLSQQGEGVQTVATAFTAMSRITHMPVNAPLLYLDRNGRLPADTRREMRRLRPDGVMQDGQTQVYIAGRFDPSVVREVERELGYKTRTFPARNPVELAELLDRWQSALKSDHEDEVIISSIDHPQGIAHGIGAMGWNAHMGKGFAWVYRDSIPDATRRILRRRLGGAYIYITGGDDVVSADVARELARYGVVRRIRGPDVYATNAVNAGFKDFRLDHRRRIESVAGDAAGDHAPARADARGRPTGGTRRSRGHGAARDANRTGGGTWPRELKRRSGRNRVPSKRGRGTARRRSTWSRNASPKTCSSRWWTSTRRAGSTALPSCALPCGGRC
jgi:hypothetical protein